MTRFKSQNIYVFPFYYCLLVLHFLRNVFGVESIFLEEKYG